MKMTIEFPGGSRVDARFGPFTVGTDQPPDSSAPTPFALFLASIGTCAGLYVKEFCRQRGISTEGLRLLQRTHSGADGMVARIGLEIQLPAGFPEKYRDSVIRAAELCAVKKHLERPPSIEVTTTAASSEFAGAP
jgi:putative redox protein